MGTKNKQYMVCLDSFNNNNNIENKAIFERDKIWKRGEKNEITITFGNYPCDECSVNAGWSLIGKEANNEPYPSMNLGFVDPPFEDFEWEGILYLKSGFEYGLRNRCSKNINSINGCETGWVPGFSVVHEFGHALGMKHEHQNNLNNSNKLDINTEYIITYMEANLGWDRETTIKNIIEWYSDPNYYNGSDFDPKSIMFYNFPKSWLNSGEGISSNFVLSDKDKEWLEKMYPKDNQIEITVYFVDSDSPSWKKAWIKKVVTEQISPHVGIKFNFSKELKPLAPGETYPPPTIEPLTPLSTTSIFVIMSVSFILFTILVYYVR